MYRRYRHPYSVRGVADQPIFVVGAPRSGTTLLAATLAAHSRIICGPETQFFNSLLPDRLADAINDRRWPRSATSAVCSLTLAWQPVVRLYGMRRRNVLRYLRNRSPSARAMLESLTQPYAERHGKARWAEKTPNHIWHLETIRLEWPEAPIIRIVRDPRDVVVSMQQLPWWSENSLLDNAAIWVDCHNRSNPFFADDPRSDTLRFEDLVTTPETELRKLCTVIGEDYEPGMLDTSRSAEHVTTKQEPWKSFVSHPIDSRHAFRWRDQLPAADAEAIAARCADGMNLFGYVP